jgi:PAS domain S-box-containing protein
MKDKVAPPQPAQTEVEYLRARLDEAEQTLMAIRHGEIDALVVKGHGGSHVYTLKGADHAYRVLIESMNEGAVTLSHDGTVLYCNRSFATMVEVPLENIIGSSLFKYLVTPEQKLFSKLIAQNGHTKRELHLQTPTHGSVPVLVSFTPLKLDDDSLGTSIIVTDLTEAKRNEAVAAAERLSAETLVHEQAARQKLEEREERFRTLIEQSSDAIQLVSREGKILYSSNSVKQVLGYTPEELAGQNCAPFIHPDDLSYFTERVEELIADPSQRPTFQYRVKHKDGSWAWIEATGANHLSTPNIHALVANFRNITARKELERQKDDFIGIASHELKTPVTSIKAYTQIMQRRFKRRGDQDSAENMGRINAQLDKLTLLIGDLLDVTKIEAGQLQFNMTTFDFDQLVSDAVDSMNPTTDRHVITVEGSAGTKVTGDRERILQVLVNLLSNAIKYSPHTDDIIVRVESDTGHVTVSVQDFGIGISQDKREHIFERFARVSGPRNESFPGLGLGLYISSEIVKRLGGRIWVTGGDSGSTFHFYLPHDMREPESD